jgi:predicted RNA-binding Zn ribbon-like protein
MTERGRGAFQFGGRLALDLTWTVRYRAVQPTELLAEPADLRRWLETVELPAPSTPTPADLAAARELREAIHRAATSVIEGRLIEPGDRSLLNRFAAHPPAFPELRPDGTRGIIAPAGAEVPAALSALARDAIELLASADGRLRHCDGPRCSLLFHDNSRPGTRRWCTTTRCGNKVNTHAYRERRRDID